MSQEPSQNPTISQPRAGLTSTEAAERLIAYGRNELPETRPPSLLVVFVRQFLSPLIYILLIAAAVSVALGDLTDAAFITIVLLMNGVIGAAQEYSAGRAAAALRKLAQSHATALRDGVPREIDAGELVPGDLVLLESGVRVPADIRLVESEHLQCDESLLTGESMTVSKEAGASAGDSHGRTDKRGTAFAGTLVTRGRGRGHVVATGLHTEIGRIAEQVGRQSLSKPPLMIRMERFTKNIALAVGLALVLLVAIGLVRGMEIEALFMMSVGLAVSAIPEGLPVAISIALAISMRRMSRENVIVRNMPAVESLGSCTLIATDKTGTLTKNELAVTDLCLPDGRTFVLESGRDAVSGRILPSGAQEDMLPRGATRLLRAATLPNEGRLVREQGEWTAMGDSVDTALLGAAYKGQITQEDLLNQYPMVARIPYEPDLKYAASFHKGEEAVRVFVKGAPEAIIEMAEVMDMGGEPVAIDHARLLRQKDELTGRGLRVLAFAEGRITAEPDGPYGHHHLVKLTFLGMAGLRDAIRPEVPQAIRQCADAGITVVMVTGDDPKTASVIAREAGMEVTDDQVVTGLDVRQAEDEGPAALDRLTSQARVYARVEPIQKLAIVLSLVRAGHFVAVTGDGVNDAPALKHAHVGVAMGRKGTEVAKESADIIITDDHFASIVAGIREGRVAYGNIRKVIFMLVSTGVAEVILFLLAMSIGTPLPLLPVQLLWLNLVTNGIQDVALASEKAEGDELHYPPRRPNQPIFDRLMVSRILTSSAVMGFGGFAVFVWLLDRGYDEATARNLLLLLMVLFENVQTFNSRSERHSIIVQPISANPFLIFGVIAAQSIHIAALYLPGLSDVLQTAPVSLTEWLSLLAIAMTLLLVMEAHKYYDQTHLKRLALS